MAVKTLPKKLWQGPFEIRDLIPHSDHRGTLFEILRFLDWDIPGEGQIYTSTIEPGKRRGDHYHKKKSIWFTCVYGEITFLLNSEDGKKAIVPISASHPKVLYVAPGTNHALVNNGSHVAVMVAYVSQQLDPNAPDIHRKIVDVEGAVEIH